jgi:GNAT superfamily N-acetyltransferase
VSEIAVERVTNHDAAVLWHEVNAAAMAADHVGLPAEPLEEVEERIRDADADKRVELWLGRHHGEAVVAGEINVPVLDNVESAHLDVEVHPGSRRRGYGRAMFTRLVERARAHGRGRIFFEAPEPFDGAGDSAGSAFGRAMGARPVSREIRRVLTLREADDARLKTLYADAAEAAAGYSLLQWIDRAPDDVLDDLAVLMGRMSTDAPLEDREWEPEAWDADRYRAEEVSVLARGRRRFVTAARHDRTGRLVAYTDIGMNLLQRDFAFQWSTIVLHPHRGHRLGMLVKLANLEHLRQANPEAEILNTWNAAVNGHMVAINEAMGFRPVECWREWQLDLPRSEQAE